MPQKLKQVVEMLVEMLNDLHFTCLWLGIPIRFQILMRAL